MLSCPASATGKFSSVLTPAIAASAMDIAKKIIDDSYGNVDEVKRARYYACAIGWFESGFGIYADTFTVENDVGLVGPSYNWGACNWSDTLVSGLDAYQFLSKDTDSTGKSTRPVRPAFSGSDARSNGFRYFLRLWVKGRPTVAKAALSSDVLALSKAMYDAGYYTGFKDYTPEQRISQYARLIWASVANMESALGEKSGIQDPKLPPPTKGDMPIQPNEGAPFPWLMVGGIAIVGGAAWYWTKGKRGKR